jgi:hypothetical protein
MCETSFDIKGKTQIKGIYKVGAEENNGYKWEEVKEVW